MVASVSRRKLNAVASRSLVVAMDSQLGRKTLDIEDASRVAKDIETSLRPMIPMRAVVIRLLKQS